MVHKTGRNDKGTQFRWQVLFEGGKESRKNPESKGKEKNCLTHSLQTPNPKQPSKFAGVRGSPARAWSEQAQSHWFRPDWCCKADHDPLRFGSGMTIQTWQKFFLTQPPASSSPKASLSPGASQLSPGKSLAARFQLSLLWRAPRYRDHGSQGSEAWADGGHERARGAHGARGWPGRCSPRPAGRTGCWDPAAPPSPDSPKSPSSPRGDPGPISLRAWERDRRVHGQPCPRYLRRAHAVAMITIAARPVPLLVIAAAATEQLTQLTNYSRPRSPQRAPGRSQSAQPTSLLAPPNPARRPAARTLDRFSSRDSARARAPNLGVSELPTQPHGRSWQEATPPGDANIRRTRPREGLIGWWAGPKLEGVAIGTLSPRDGEFGFN